MRNAHDTLGRADLLRLHQPLFFLPGAANATVQLTLDSHKGQPGDSDDLLFADIVITATVRILFLFFNKRIVAGMVAGAVKG